MKKEKAMALLEGFPSITENIKQKVCDTLRAYLIIGKGTAYCTRCRQTFEVVSSEYIHRDRELQPCPCCGTKATVIKTVHNFNGSVREDNSNVIVFLNNPDNDYLYISCFSVGVFFRHGEIMPIYELTESQRYVFTDNTAIRYGKNHYYEMQSPYRYIKRYDEQWTARALCTEPQFYYNGDYSVINENAIQQTCLRHSAEELYKGPSLIIYLKFWQKHRGAERLLKCGLGKYVISTVEKRWDSCDIDWQETEPHRMLGVTKDVFRSIQSGRISLTDYRRISERYKNTPLEKLIEYNRIIENCYGALDTISRMVTKKETAILKYIAKSGVTVSDYYDYIRLARSLDYDLNDSSVKFPPHFKEAHDRLELARQALEEERKQNEQAKSIKSFEKLKKERKQLEASFGDYVIRQPHSMEEIVDEGIKLSHCVGGYALRHADGTTTIMFLRKKSDPDTPFYTIEVSKNYKLVQCRGYANNWESRGGTPKPPEIIDIEKKYQAYLDTLKSKKRRKTA